MPVVRDLFGDILETSIPMMLHCSDKATVERLKEQIGQFAREPISPLSVHAMRTELTVLRNALRLIGVDLEEGKKKALAPVNQLDTILLAFQEYFIARNKS